MRTRQVRSPWRIVRCKKIAKRRPQRGRLFCCEFRRAAQRYKFARTNAEWHAPVGVDAHIDPAGCNRKIARIFGENVKRPVGADASVRPWGNDKLAATFRKNGRVSCGSMRRPQASFEAQPRAARLLAPKMGIDPYKHGTDSHWCVCVRGGIPPGGQRRPPLRVQLCLH